MTKVNLHGLLAFEFGKSMEFFIRKPKDVFQAIDVNRKGFYNRIIELAKDGYQYSIVIDGKDLKDLKELEIKKQPETIDLVPAIVGTGSGGFLVALGAIAMFVPGLQGIGIALIGMGVSMMLAPKPTPLEAPKAAVGTASALNQSFYFSNTANLTQQGSAVPVGYGRLKIGSLVIQVTQTSYPIELSSNEAKEVADSIRSIQSETEYAITESRS
jgi:predicted phage tail protein